MKNISCNSWGGIDKLSLAYTTKPSRSLFGEVSVPGDKSISHRALIFSALADGKSHITGLNSGDDLVRSVNALKNLGVKINWHGSNTCIVNGVGDKGFSQPRQPIDFGNSGTSARLFIGALASQPINVRMLGDESLQRRPMRRVTKPLESMGALFCDTQSHRLPLAMTGSKLRGLSYRLPMPSAQVKSAILIAGLKADGETEVIEPIQTRDHTERMLQHYGAELDIIREQDCSFIRIRGGQSLRAADFEVPGDPSAAMFIAAAALIVPGSEIIIKNVCWNPTRCAAFQVLKQMGADIEVTNHKAFSGEEAVDLRVKYSTLRGVCTLPENSAILIDEFPILAILAAFANGDTRLSNLRELRFKESDRFAAIVKGLRACGVLVSVEGEDIIVHGRGPEEVSGMAMIDSQSDHRIAMSFIILGLASHHPVTVRDIQMIATSFPLFLKSLKNLGAMIKNT